jgi:hypothetical protein
MSSGRLRSSALALLAGRLRSPALALLAGALAVTLPARADEPPSSGQTRATIRGTGNDVSIVYKGVTEKAPKRGAAATGTARLSGGPASSQTDLLGEATRMAEHGADDQSLIQYFRTHQSELPDVVDNDAVRKLRKAGAGQAVVGYLSRLSAVDIGETAEGAPQQYADASPSQGPSGYSSDFPSADMGYPYYGSYGGYGGYGGGRFGHGHRGFAGKNGPGFGFGFGSHRPAMPSHPIASRPPSMGGMHGGAHGGFGRRNP